MKYVIVFFYLDYESCYILGIRLNLDLNLIAHRSR